MKILDENGLLYLWQKIKAIISKTTGIPVNGVIDYEGDTIPEGYEEVESENVYSTEETFTGKYWVNENGDKKRIYSKVIRSKTGAINTSNLFPIGVNNLEYITHYEAKIYNWADIWSLPFSTSDTLFSFSFAKTSNSFREQHNNDYWNNWDIEITVEYTKTTD